MSIHRVGYQKSGICAFYSLVDWVCYGSGAVNAALFEDSLDLLGSNQRPRGVVHRDVSCSCVQMFQASAHGILPVFTTRNDRPNLFEIFIANDRFDFIVPVFPGDDDDSIDRAGAFKCAYRVRDDWFAGNRDEQFIEAHALAAAGCDENC